MRYVIQACALLIAFGGFTWYIKQDPEKYRRTPPEIFTKWSRQGRLAFVWSSMVLLVVLVPLGLTIAFVALDEESCNSAVPFAWACNAVVRIPVAVSVLGVIVAVVLKGSTVLARIQNYGVDYDRY